MPGREVRLSVPPDPRCKGTPLLPPGDQSLEMGVDGGQSTCGKSSSTAAVMSGVVLSWAISAVRCLCWKLKGDSRGKEGIRKEHDV